MKKRFLIVGLGNPGKKYEDTRHNIGFEIIDLISKKAKIPLKNKSKLKSQEGSGTLSGEDIILLMPQTFMNLSGEAVKSALDFYKISTNHLIVVGDDIDLEVGSIRIRATGSSGGHNGIKSIIDHVGSKDFIRVRIGVGKPSSKGENAAAEYVLSKIPKSDREELLISVVRAADAVEAIVEKGAAAAANSFN